MNRRNILASGAALLASGGLLAAAVPAAVAGSTAPKVSVRIEGVKQTLRYASTVTPKAVSRGGHKCAANTAAAALNTATAGRWSGSWSSSYKDFEVTKIDGETDNYTTTKTYWEFFVNGVPASLGVCNQKLKAGEQLLFAAVGATESPGDPIVISGHSGGPYTVDYVTPKGKKLPLAGATVTVWGVESGAKTAPGPGEKPAAVVKTNAKGVAAPKVTKRGLYTVIVTKKGYIRAETSFSAAA